MVTLVLLTGPRYRFAPSPTGFFHVGGARTALWNWALARREGGTFVLRIEDTDEARNRPEWTQGIIDALAWLGISSDDPHFEGPYFQSNYAAQHVAAAHRLFESGAAYYCDMTAADIEARNKADGTQGYQGYSRDRGLGPAPGHALRFRVPEGVTVVRDVVRVDGHDDAAESVVGERAQIFIRPQTAVRANHRAQAALGAAALPQGLAWTVSRIRSSETDDAERLLPRDHDDGGRRHAGGVLPLEVGRRPAPAGPGRPGRSVPTLGHGVTRWAVACVVQLKEVPTRG